MKTYHIHDNGGRPFKVEIEGKTVRVYKQTDLPVQGGTVLTYTDEPVLTFKNVEKVFIGKSPKRMMTKFSGGHGPAFDGNSILLHIEGLKYVYIGSEIFSFYALGKIVKYVSLVGNNDVPYPYAVDKEGRNYLMIEDVVLENAPKNKDPYSYYYTKNFIVNYSPDKRPSGFKNITEFLIGNSKYTFSYNSRPEKDYDRISKWDDFGEGMKIVTKDGKEEHLTRGGYVKLLKEFGKVQGFSPLRRVKILHKRL
jgi:hypothetical protein